MSRAVPGLLCALLAGALGACGGDGDPQVAEGELAWRPVATLAFDPATGQTPLLPLAAGEGRVTLRVHSEPGVCFQVADARDGAGQRLAEPFTGPFCATCAWRTSRVRTAGLLVLEGRAAGLSQIAFGRVNCQTLRPTAGPGPVTVARLDEPPAAADAGLALRLVASAEVDPEALAADVSQELAGLPVAVVATLAIPAQDLPLEGRDDDAALAALLADLPPRPAGVIDVVVGPCLTRADPFGTQRLAGLTPRIPGGAGPADAVFVSRQTCGLGGAASDDPRPEDPTRLARVVAHELGHYLGLFHAEDADGAVDDLPDTTSENLMDRAPLRADARGLTPAQVARLRAHPFVR